MRLTFARVTYNLQTIPIYGADVKIWIEQLPLISDILIGLRSFLRGSIYPEEIYQHV